MRTKYLALLVFLGACNSNLKVQTTSIPAEETPDVNGGEQPTQEPPEPLFAGTFDFTRTHFQTRSVIGLRLNQEIMQNGERFTVTNETTQLKLLDNEIASLMLSNQTAFITNNGAYLYYFYPASSSSSGAFAYGENMIRMDIHDPNMPRYATSTIVLRDFDIFGEVVTHFDENSQEKGNFQGWINKFSNPVVSTNGGAAVLTTGMQNIINQ